MEIFVKTLQGQSFSLSGVEPSDTMQDLGRKLEVAANGRYFRNTQRLIYCGQEVTGFRHGCYCEPDRGNRCLSDLDIKEHATLHLVTRMRGDDSGQIPRCIGVMLPAALCQAFQLSVGGEPINEEGSFMEHGLCDGARISVLETESQVAVPLSKFTAEGVFDHWVTCGEIIDDLKREYGWSGEYQLMKRTEVFDNELPAIAMYSRDPSICIFTGEEPCQVCWPRLREMDGAVTVRLVGDTTEPASSVLEAHLMADLARVASASCSGDEITVRLVTEQGEIRVETREGAPVKATVQRALGRL